MIFGRVDNIVASSRHHYDFIAVVVRAANSQPESSARPFGKVKEDMQTSCLDESQPRDVILAD